MNTWHSIALSLSFNFNLIHALSLPPYPPSPKGLNLFQIQGAKIYSLKLAL